MNLITNKKAKLNYELMNEYEAGLDLLGFEVKSLRARQGSLEGAHVIIRGSEAFLVGATIPPYQPNNTPSIYEPGRARRLLLSKKQIGELAGSERQKGLTIVPISVYNKGRFLKLKFAIARGKKKHDKRETIKKRDAKREMDRQMKQQF